jgi:hypothetical protein
LRHVSTSFERRHPCNDHPRVFSRPSALDEVIGFCELLIAQPHCAVIHPGPQHCSIFVRLCKDADARGNLVPDAWFAALAVESGCDWVTTDGIMLVSPDLNGTPRLEIQNTKLSSCSRSCTFRTAGDVHFSLVTPVPAGT